MNSKEFRKKMEALYKGVDPSKSQDDNKILRYELGGYTISEIRKLYPERFEKSKEERQMLSDLHLERQQLGTFRLLSPGSDLLHLYDKFHKEYCSKDNNLYKIKQAPVPPSVVFKLRFKTKFPRGKKVDIIWNEIKQYIPQNLHEQYSRKYPPQVMFSHFKWLLDTESKILIECDNRINFEKEIYKKFGCKSSLFVKGNKKEYQEQFFFKGKLKGHLVTYTPA